jgi:hypothetical protein
MIQTLSPPSRSLVNTTDLPSGEKCGWASYGMPVVSGGCRTTADRYGIKVAEQIEDDRASVRRDVERDPGAFVRVEIDRASRHELEIGFFGVGLRVVSC